MLKPKGRLIVGEIFIDPDFINPSELQDRTRRAGLALDRKTGNRLAYLARFETT